MADRGRGHNYPFRPPEGSDFGQRPTVRQQVVDPAVRMRAHPSEHVSQVGERLVAQVLATLHQAQQRCCGLASAITPEVQPVFPTKGNRPDRILGRVVVDRQIRGTRGTASMRSSSTGRRRSPHPLGFSAGPSSPHPPATPRTTPRAAAIARCVAAIHCAASQPPSRASRSTP